MKSYFLAILIYSFLGYLWYIFSHNLINFVNENDINIILSFAILLIGFTLFFEICRRISPFYSLKFNHPLRITGILSFLICVILIVVIDYI